MIDLTKVETRKQSVIDLKKQKGIANQTAQVVLCLDYSYSMEKHYMSGYVQNAIEKLLPLGLAFDDNGEVDFYLFENSVTKLPQNITLKNIDGYINSKVIGKYRMGGTNYAPAINKIVKDFKSTGLFGGAKPMDCPVYVMFITDGNNDDKTATEKAIQEASKHGLFFQFVGIGGLSFDFLQKLDNLSGRLIDNANFFKVPDLNTCSDNELYSLLMNEFPQWLPLAKNANLIK